MTQLRASLLFVCISFLVMISSLFPPECRPCYYVGNCFVQITLPNNQMVCDPTCTVAIESHKRCLCCTFDLRAQSPFESFAFPLS